MSNLADIFTKYKAVVFFDTETSGLDADTCQIIELAAIRIEQTARGTLRMADTADTIRERAFSRYTVKRYELEAAL